LGHPIHPEANTDLPASQQSLPSNTETGKSIADLLNRAVGEGDAYHKGLLDMYPGTVDYWGSFLTQGVGSFVRNGYNGLEKAWEGEPTPYEKMPFFHRFMTNPENLPNSKFSELKHDIDAKERLMAKAYRDFRTDNKNIEAKQAAEEISKELGVHLYGNKVIIQKNSVPGILRQTEKEVKGIQTKIDSINRKDIPSTDKQELIAPLNQKMMDIKNKGRKKINEKLPKSQSPLNLLMGE
jgi:hypothetical protein